MAIRINADIVSISVLYVIVLVYAEMHQFISYILLYVCMCVKY